MIINGVQHPGVSEIEAQIRELELSVKGLERVSEQPDMQKHLGHDARPALLQHWFAPIMESKIKIRELQELALTMWKIHIEWVPEEYENPFHLDLTPAKEVKRRMQARIDELEAALDTSEEDAELAYIKDNFIENGVAYAYADQDARWY